MHQTLLPLGQEPGGGEDRRKGEKAQRMVGAIGVRSSEMIATSQKLVESSAVQPVNPNTPLPIFTAN
jgi:hypothetical protein